jgi:hypothetical protein
MPLVDGKSMPERPVIVEGRGAQSIREDGWRLIVRSPIARRIRKGGSEFEKALELYDMKDDPGERVDVAASNKDIVARLQRELAEHQSSVKPATVVKGEPGVVRLRFATAGRAARVDGTVRLVGDGKLRVMADESEAHVKPIGPNEFQVSFQTKVAASVGLKLLVEPAEADVKWQWSLDGAPWPIQAVFGGPLGIQAPKLAEGINGFGSDEWVASQLPYISVRRETGLFVARELRFDTALNLSESAQIEAQQAMQAWGYVRRPEVAKTAKPAP